ncbi:NADH-quinone oxidoreductase subunit A [Chitinophaga ginsengisegetis]|uniref:NADH-quinone oxidoreductase subunit A n=1 Tax=Chitinophaga ginsengisegetis TaxID=393003 RepID=A0A1T5NMH8_9BACT|nr:NADH-quinone oxidoreductase subunit A [Chitinophaga ginsengisegetis]
MHIKLKTSCTRRRFFSFRLVKKDNILNPNRFDIWSTYSIFAHSDNVFIGKLMYTETVFLSATTTPFSYFPIVLQLIAALGFVGITMLATHFLGPKRKTSDKLINFESGIEQKGNARQPVAIKYFLTAILFVLFDVEVIFFYPYAVNFRELGWEGFTAVLMFVGFFLCGFIYITKKGALKWED